mmetsp:Transcript_75291/g.140399  ORF Transcript_75291/g.140399 Transcript_75291/m.140399 type:complete len:82 (+) Transcript_75291:1-246(+)
MSGRTCLVALENRDALSHDVYEVLLGKTCSKFGFRCSGNESLLYGAEAVPSLPPVREWPGCPAQGMVAEYQLVISKRPRVA